MKQAQGATQEQPMSDRSRWTALYVLCAGMLMIVLDITIVNVALPSIQDSLGFSQSNLAWVVNAYLIAFGGLLLLSNDQRGSVLPPIEFADGTGAGDAALVQRRQQGLVVDQRAAGDVDQRSLLSQGLQHFRVDDVARGFASGAGDAQIREAFAAAVDLFQLDECEGMEA